MLCPRDRRALAAVAVQFFANGAMTASFIARAPQIRDRIGVSVEGYGLLLTISATVGVASSLLAGRIVDAASTRRVLVAGAVAMVLSLPVIGGARSPAVWLIGMFTYVFVDTLVDISMNLQGSWISARRHTPVMNRLHGLWSVGLLAGGLGAAAANAAGMSPFVHLTIVSVVMVGVLAVVTHNLLPTDEDGHGDEPAAAPSPAGRRVSRAPLVLLVLAGVFAVLMEVTGGDWATFRLTDDFDATAAIASLAFVAYSVGMAAMRFGGDFLQPRLGRMGLHRLSVAIAIVGFVVATLVPTPDGLDRRVLPHRSRRRHLHAQALRRRGAPPRPSRCRARRDDGGDAHRLPGHPGDRRRPRGHEPVGRTSGRDLLAAGRRRTRGGHRMERAPAPETGWYPLTDELRELSRRGRRRCRRARRR